MADPVAVRRAEQQRLIATARRYVERLSRRAPITAAVVAGSVARGDFNVWSDIDVVIVADGLPERLLDRQDLLLSDAESGVQAIAFTPAEFRVALAKRNKLAHEAVEIGVPLVGGPALRAIAADVMSGPRRG